MLGCSPDVPSNSKNALGPIGIPLKKANLTPPRRVKVWWGWRPQARGMSSDETHLTRSIPLTPWPVKVCPINWFKSALLAGLRICWLYFPLCQKGRVLSITLNWIWCCGSSSGDLVECWVPLYCHYSQVHFDTEW